MKPLADCYLYTFVDAGYLHGRSVADLARQLCEGGSDIIQLRAKGTPIDEVRRMAEAILPVTQQAGIPLVINDHIDVAIEVGAPLCHLGQEDFFNAGHQRVAELIPPVSQLQIGLSSHAPSQAHRAIGAGAVCLGVGPVFSTATKPESEPATLEYVHWAAAHVVIPWFAIGGISLENLDSVVAAGGRRVCVISAILNAPDIAKACQQFKKRLSV
jgi:thiamine-phosphate pyrophosphorylase